MYSACENPTVYHIPSGRQLSKKKTILYFYAQKPQGHPTNLFLTLSVPQRNLAGWQKYRCFDELAGKFCY